MKYDNVEADALVKIGRNLFVVAAVVDDDRIRLDSGKIVRRAGVEVVGSPQLGQLYRSALRAKENRKLARLTQEVFRQIARAEAILGRIR